MSVFEQVKDALDIRAVVEFYGSNVDRHGKFICPFHADHKPSASIKNNYFKCFVCGVGGDCITYTAKLFGIRSIDACKKLNDDFNLGLTFGYKKENSAKISTTARLRADRERQKRLQQNKERADIEKLIHRTGVVLADYHCYLWQGIHLYPLEDKRHIRGLQRITDAQYFLECYDAEPERYSIENRKGVKAIEKRLYRWNHENE